MAVDGTWGTDTEMCVLAHLLNSVIYNFNSSGYWLSCLPHGIDRTIPYNVQCRYLYIYNHHELHFDVITDVLSLRAEIRCSSGVDLPTRLVGKPH